MLGLVRVLEKATFYSPKDWQIMTHPEQTPQEWFQEAARWFVEKHQGCPWCGGENCVYHSRRQEIIEYYCGSCEFFAGHDVETGHFSTGPGRRPAPATMVEVPSVSK